MSVRIGDTIAGTTTLHVEECPSCGCAYAIPDGIYRDGQSRTNKRTIYCPNGHPWHFTGKTHEQEVRELHDALARARAEADQAEAAERMAVAREAKERKARKRLQERAAAGVCPCCHRHFVNVERHVATKHPEFREEATK